MSGISRRTALRLTAYGLAAALAVSYTVLIELFMIIGRTRNARFIGWSGAGGISATSAR